LRLIRPLPIPIDATITEGEIRDMVKLFRMIEQAEVRGRGRTGFGAPYHLRLRYCPLLGGS
jgi:hypothetical protein